MKNNETNESCYQTFGEPERIEIPQPSVDSKDETRASKELKASKNVY